MLSPISPYENNNYYQNGYYNNNYSNNNVVRFQKQAQFNELGNEMFEDTMNGFARDMNPYESYITNPFEVMNSLTSGIFMHLYANNIYPFVNNLYNNIFPPLFNPVNYIPGNEDAKMWGDPHFKGADGMRFDFQGQAGKDYNLFSTRGIHLNGHFASYGNGNNVVDKTGLTLGGPFNNDSVTYNANGEAEVNGTEIQEGQTVELSDGSTATLQDGTLTVTTPQGYTITQTDVDGQYIDIDVQTGANGVYDEGSLPGGLIGQTFHPEWMAPRGSEMDPEAYAQRFERNQLTPYNTWSFNQMA